MASNTVFELYVPYELYTPYSMSGSSLSVKDRIYVAMSDLDYMDRQTVALMIQASLNNTALTGNTTAQNITVSGSIIVPTPSTNTQATPKGYVLGLSITPTFTQLEDGTYSLSAMSLTEPVTSQGG